MATLRKRRLPSGRSVWQVDFVDATGKRHRLEKNSRSEAKTLAFEKEKSERQARPPVANPDLTVHGCAQWWLAYIKDTVAERTLAGYAQILDLYLIPIIGDEKLLNLHGKLVGNLLTAWAEQGKSPNTVRLIRSALSAMCADAVDEGFLDRNPVPEAGGRRRRRMAAKQRKLQLMKRIRPFSDEQRTRFLDKVKSDPLVYQSLFSLMCESGGPRPDEALSLEWKTVDLRESKAEIWQTKTSTWKTVDLALQTVELLRRLRVHAAKDALRSGRDPEGLVFKNRDGKKIDQSRLNKRLKRVLKDAELPIDHSIYDLRHTWATIKLAKGTPLTYVASQLGHANPETTLRWYAHWIPGEKPSTHSVGTRLAHAPKARRRKYAK